MPPYLGSGVLLPSLLTPLLCTPFFSPPDYVYFENSSSNPYLVRRIEELNKVREAEAKLPPSPHFAFASLLRSLTPVGGKVGEKPVLSVSSKPFLAGVQARKVLGGNFPSAAAMGLENFIVSPVPARCPSSLKNDHFSTAAFIIIIFFFFSPL